MSSAWHVRHSSLAVVDIAVCSHREGGRMVRVA